MRRKQQHETRRTGCLGLGAIRGGRYFHRAERVPAAPPSLRLRATDPQAPKPTRLLLLAGLLTLACGGGASAVEAQSPPPGLDSSAGARGAAAPEPAVAASGELPAPVELMGPVGEWRR